MDRSQVIDALLQVALERGKIGAAREPLVPHQVCAGGQYVELLPAPDLDAITRLTRYMGI